jgi:hypothetical protein
MSSPTVLANHSSATWFAPCPQEIIHIGKTSALLYPKVDASMSDPEKAIGFQQYKTALASADLDQWEHILTLANCLDLMLTTEAALANRGCKLSCNWANFANLTILS